MTNLSPISISQEQIRAVFASRDLSETTIKQYSYGIKAFRVFLGGNSLNRNTLLEFKRFLREQIKNEELSDSTAGHYLASAKVFLEQLHRAGKIPDIYSHVKLFKQEKGHKRDGLFSEEIEKLFRYISELEYSIEKLRLKAICFLKYFHSFRDIELYRLNVGNLNFGTENRESVQVMGKGRDKYKTIRLHPIVVKALKEYLAAAGIDKGPVFVSFSRNDSQGERLSRRSLGGIISNALRKSGIANRKSANGRYNKSPHGLKHSSITKHLKITNGNVALTSELTRTGLQSILTYKDKIDIEEDLPSIFEGFNTI